MTQKLLPFTGHLEEFRRRLLASLAALLAGTLLGFVFVDRILRALIQPIRPRIGEVYFFSPADALVIKIKAALLAGLIVASPFIFCQLWLFLAPGLHPHEKKMAAPLLFIVSFLFVIGALFSFFAVLPPALDFLIGQRTEFLKPMVSMSEYLGFLSGMMIAFGFAFNLPVFVVTAAAGGLVSVRTLNRYRRHAIVAIFIAAAVLTPGPDIASQLMLAIPLVILFEISVAAAWLVEKIRGKERRS